MDRLSRAVLVTGAIGIFALAGCVERELTVTSDPPGALVMMNDQEAGRTPFQREFLWYGTYDVSLRKEGYEPLKTTAPVIAPWWQWIPFDLLAEIVPVRLKDSHKLHFSMKPSSSEGVAPEDLIQRGQSMRHQLESGQKTVSPATRPSTRPGK